MREAESVMPVETYLNRRMLQWYGDVGRRVERQRVSCLWRHTSIEGCCSGMEMWEGDERGRECHGCGDIPQ